MDSFTTAILWGMGASFGALTGVVLFGLALWVFATILKAIFKR